MFAVARAVHAQMALPQAVIRYPQLELAERVRHADEQDAAYERARILIEDLAAMRRRRAAIWN